MKKALIIVLVLALLLGIILFFTGAFSGDEAEPVVTAEPTEASAPLEGVPPSSGELLASATAEEEACITAKLGAEHYAQLKNEFVPSSLADEVLDAFRLCLEIRYPN